MVYPKRPLAALMLLVIATTTAISVSAQNSAADQQKLNEYRAQLSTLQREEGELRQQITAKQRELETVRSKPSPEQAELADARQQVEAARAEFKASPTPENDAKLKNAEFKHTLADRKFAKGNAEAAAISTQIEQLQRQLSSRQSQIAGVNQQISTQATANAQLDQRLAKERSQRELQAKELEQSKRDAEAAQKEIAQLKAMLAQKEAATAAGVKTAAVAKPAAAAVVAAPAVAAAAKPAAAVAVAKPVSMPVAAAPAAAASIAKPATASGGDTSIAKLTTQSEVLGALQSLTQRVSGEEPDRRERPVNEILHFKQMQGGQEVAKRRITMNALGNGQFRGEEDVKPGSYQLVVGLKYWKLDFAPTDNGRFVFLLDYSNDKAPQLKVYNKALEGA